MSEIAGKEEDETEEEKLHIVVFFTRHAFAEAVIAYDYALSNDIKCKELGERVFKTESDYQEAYNAMCRFLEDEQLKDTQPEGTA